MLPTIPDRIPIGHEGKPITAPDAYNVAYAHPATGEVFHAGKDYMFYDEHGQLRLFKDARTKELTSQSVSIIYEPTWGDNYHFTDRLTLMRNNPRSDLVWFRDGSGWSFPMFRDDFHVLSGFFDYQEFEVTGTWTIKACHHRYALVSVEGTDVKIHHARS